MANLPYSASSWYWQVAGDTSFVWSSARFAYVSLGDSQYQTFLANGGTLNPISSENDLNGVMANQVIPNYLSTGLTIQSTGNPAINSVYALDNVTVDQVGTVARDSACGLGLPLGLATFTYPDIYGNSQTFTATQIQNLYVAMRNYIAGVYMAVASLTHKIAASLPSNSVTIP
jgi:hypothetical protein